MYRIPQTPEEIQSRGLEIGTVICAYARRKRLSCKFIGLEKDLDFMYTGMKSLLGLRKGILESKKEFTAKMLLKHREVYLFYCTGVRLTQKRRVGRISKLPIGINTEIQM